MIYKKSKKAQEKRKVRRQKTKKVAIISAVVFSVICLGAALADGIFRVSTNIDGFEKYFADASSETRKSLKGELDQFVLLNTGNPAVKSPKFVILEEDIAIETDEDGNKYSSFVIDSEELQLSAHVQMNWGGQFTKTKASFITRVDCAEENKYEDSHCYSKSTGGSVKAIGTENIGLLESYGVPKDAIKRAQVDMLNYLKMVYPEAKSALINKRTIINYATGAYSAILTIDDRSVQDYRHYSILEKQLPTEIITRNGARFMLRYVDKKHLEISSVSCKEGVKDPELIVAAREWLEENEFDPESFEIKLKNSCES